MNDFVPFEIAKKLKDKEFPQRPDYFNYSSYYDWDGLRKIHSLSNASVWFDPNISRDNLYFAPTISQVLKWLREEKNIILTPNPSYFEEDCCLGWDCDVWASGNYDYCCVDYKTYEQASIAGIEYVLDDLI